jgi:small subunit ribosomal protein S8
MSMTDPVANFLTIIRNGARAKHEVVTAPASNLNIRIAEILKQEKFIKDLRVIDDEGKRFIRIYLRYLRDGKSAIKSITRASKPGLRYYVDSDSIPKVLNGLGVAILSTSEGVFTDKTARENHVGGEVLCKVY